MGRSWAGRKRVVSGCRCQRDCRQRTIAPLADGKRRKNSSDYFSKNVVCVNKRNPTTNQQKTPPVLNFHTTDRCAVGGCPHMAFIRMRLELILSSVVSTQFSDILLLCLTPSVVSTSYRVLELLSYKDMLIIEGANPHVPNTLFINTVKLTIEVAFRSGTISTVYNPRVSLTLGFRGLDVVQTKKTIHVLSPERANRASNRRRSLKTFRTARQLTTS